MKCLPNLRFYTTKQPERNNQFKISNQRIDFNLKPISKCHHENFITMLTITIFEIKNEKSSESIPRIHD